MINPSQYCELILERAFRAVDMYSADAHYLLARTAAMESSLTHLKQVPTGPALGFMQVEGDTYNDIIRYLNIRTDIKDKILKYCNYQELPGEEHLIFNLAFNALIARVKYWMIPDPIPPYGNAYAQAEYYCIYYAVSSSEVLESRIDRFVGCAKHIDGCI